MTEEPDDYLVAHVKEALAQDERVSDLDVQVTVTPGRVFLTGEVPTPERRQAITEVVEALVADHEVHNETVVAVYSEPPDEEVLT